MKRLQLFEEKISTEKCKEMYKRAEALINNTYPKPGKVVAAVLTKNGNIYEGVNYYTDTYTTTMHAEMVALAHAATHGEKEIVAITGPNCHICKQMLWESSIRSGMDMWIVFKLKNGKFKKILLSKMMQYSWPNEKVEWAK